MEKYNNMKLYHPLMQFNYNFINSNQINKHKIKVGNSTNYTVLTFTVAGKQILVARIL